MQRSHRFAFAGTASAIALILLSSGCHTSKRAAFHAFSSDAASTMPLPDRLRNGEEHDAALRRRGNPYVFEIPAQSGGGALLYYGARHSRDRSDPQLDDIRSRWSAFGPTVAMCEGRQSRHFYGFLVEPFAGLPEPTLVHKLARANGVSLVSLEPSYQEEVRLLTLEFPREEVALYFFLRVYAQESGGSPDDGLAKHLLAKRTDVDGLRDSLVTLADVDTLWSRLYPGAPSWRERAHEPREGRLRAISDASRRTRGEHMVRAITDLVRQGERVFAVVGSGHVIRQEWALRRLFDLEPAWDQSRD